MNVNLGPAIATPRHPGAGLGLAALALLLAFLAPSAGHAQATGNRLEAIDVVTLPGQQVELKFRTSGPAPQPLAFTIDKPARISLDLPGVTLALSQRRVDVKSGGVDSVVAGESGGRTRLVLNMDELAPYETRVEGNTVIVTVGQGRNAQSQAPSTSQSASTAAASGDRRISAIDFRRGTDGVGRLVVSMSDPHTPVNLRQEGQQVVVDFVGAQLSADLVKRFDVVDFATPVTYVDALKLDGSSRLIVNAQGDYEQLAYQTDNQYVIEVRQTSPSKGKAAEDRKEYTGERLTLNFQDIDVRAVLQLLADTSGQNIVVSDSVQGGVTLRLQNVPWDQALDIVMRTKGLSMRRRDNVILVGPAEELATREKAELQARKDVEELAPLRTEYLQVNYAKASDLSLLIKGKAGNSLLSIRGSVAIDERTNTLLLQDTADRLADIRRLVGTLDIPVRQVLIESRVVIVNDDFSRQLGVRLGTTGVRARSNGLVSVSGSAAANNTIVSSALTNLQSGSGTAFPVQIPTGTTSYLDRYNVNLPVANPAGRIAMAVLSGNYLIDLELSAAQAEDRAEIVSSPHVITSNQKEATIEQGVEIPYQESSSSGATTTQFKKAVLALKVKPQITPDNRVILDLTITKDSVGQLVQSATGGQVPSIDTRTITTQVLVNDGQTVVLGGIMETERRTAETKVPLLGDLPILGYLFKTRTRTNNKDELLIFVTPKILREGANLY